MAASGRTMGASASPCLCAFVFVLLCVSGVNSQQIQSDEKKVEISYFPNSLHNGFRGQFAEDIRQQDFNILQLQEDNFEFPFRGDLVDTRNNVGTGGSESGIALFRKRRAVTTHTVTEEKDENTEGRLFDFKTKLSDLVGRRFSLVSISSHDNMFELTSAGLFNLRPGFTLDYEDSSMRSFIIVVNATNNNNLDDVMQVTATLTINNVDEAPVFITVPQPYLATVRANSGAGFNIIDLEARDPENAQVYYEKTLVSPNSYSNRIELRTVPNGCQLLTFGAGNFLPEGRTITITVSARDSSNGGRVTSVPVSVLIGVRNPQFFQTTYQGSMPEQNQPQQTVYQLGTTDELRVRVKTFQEGSVTLSLTADDGSPSDLFDINSEGYIVCRKVLDYETINPKNQSLTITAIEQAGNSLLSSTVTVTVNILDVNDNAPAFDQVQYLVPPFPEDTNPGTVILNVTARDADTGEAGRVVYTVLNSEDFDVVTGAPDNNGISVGFIRVKRRLDYDRPEGPYYEFQVRAEDRGNPVMSSITNVQVTVTNVNDEVPQFADLSSNPYTIMENANLGKVITQILATDKDGDNVFYTISKFSPSPNKFTINRESGLLTLISEITDNDNLFTLDIEARDDGSCCESSTQTNSNTTTITVQVNGINSHKPYFAECSSYNPIVNEHSDVGTPVLTVSAEDNDRGPNGVVTYFLTQNTENDKFAIDSKTGVITVADDIDREAIAFVQVTVRGKDGGSPELEGWCTFRITINDTNDNAPAFDHDQYTANITTALQTQASFLAVRAYDRDVGNNAKINYSLINDAEGKFGIIPENGFIYLRAELAQANIQYSLTAMAMDAGHPPKNSTVGVIINVKLGPINPPKWDQSYNDKTYNVSESLTPGSVIIQNMTCNSNIQNQNVEFQLIDENGKPGVRTNYFYLQRVPNTANRVNVLATGKFDYATNREHIIRIRCLNFGAVTLPVEVNPKVTLYDTNNQVPQFDGLNAGGRYDTQIPENQDADVSVMTIRASDRDATDAYNTLTFSIVNPDEANFTIGPGDTKNTAILRTSRVFNREEVDFYWVKVLASDGSPSSISGTNGPNTAEVNVKVSITDENDNPPYFNQTLYNIEVDEDFYINELIYPAIVAQDPDSSDRGRHTYRILSGNGLPVTFGVRNRLGNLFLLRKLDYEANDKHFLLVLEASDGVFSNTTTVNVTVKDVNDNPPVFDPNNFIVDWVVENDEDVPKLLLTLTATDADIDRPNNIQYSLKAPDKTSSTNVNVNQFFSIRSDTGQLYLQAPLDREAGPYFELTVVAKDEDIDPRLGYATVSVRPQDLNDNAPEFVTNPLQASVPEHSEPGTSVVLLTAKDDDFMENGTVTFSIISIEDGASIPRPGYFTIDSDSGLVETATLPDNLDRETQDTYRLEIQLTDGGNPQQQTRGTLVVTLSDINDQRPIFEQRVYRTQMSEKQVSGEVIRVVAKDGDIGDNANVFYSLAENSRFFTVKRVKNEGSVQIGSPVDYEDPGQRLFNLTVIAKDNGLRQDECSVIIEVLDFNDNAPVVEPETNTTRVLEDAPKGMYLATFTATDIDSGINQLFDFSISRDSDPKRQFSIDPQLGHVKIRTSLDRETVERHELKIQAIDRGDPPKTGSATLIVIVDDVNDNYPTFLEDYQPQVLEEEGAGVRRLVQLILAKDPDAPPFGAPYGFSLGTCPQNKDHCSFFQFDFNAAGAGGNGTASVFTDQLFDREKHKYYHLPIVMWDMRGSNSPLAMTGTNTLTITIADINDNDMKEGTQNIFVYNYKGTFGPLEIGRVYVEDPDDWDLPDKTFTFTSPSWMEKYFTVNSDTGMVTMQKGVPDSGAQPFVFQVKVEDRKFGSTVISTVAVTVQELSEAAVKNSGAVRLTGTSAEDFIIVPPATSSNSDPQSQMTRFRTLLAAKMNVAVSKVQVISVQDVEGGFTDVRYAVSGSPYFSSAMSDSAVTLNQNEFEDLGLTISEVPIDACAEEVFEGGCYNYMDITGNPALVNANGTSFVGVEVFIRAREGCRAEKFPVPNECSADYCYHGGVCVKDDFGVISCQNCPEGFKGPRCQQLRHSFNGNSYAMYPTLEQCEDSETSIEFITTQPDGLLFYNGPLVIPTADQPADFISLELSGGSVVLHIDHGSGTLPLRVDSSLADGKWHKVDIVRKGKSVTMIVDDCRAAGPSGSETQLPDTSSCQSTGYTPGENSFLNVASLLQVGGRRPGHTFPVNTGISGQGFNGCVRSLIHNSKLYDLYFKEMPNVPSGQNGCPREDEICGTKCGLNGICSADLNTRQSTCVCNAGWRGNTCTQETTQRHLKSNSFLQWQLKNSFVLPSYHLELQVMYRTWSENGVLFTASSNDNTQRVTLEIKDGHLQVLYNLDSVLLLNETKAADGQWHVARFKKIMHLATLTLDAGEGRNYEAQRMSPNDNVYMTLSTITPFFAGASVTPGPDLIDSDLVDTCIQDVRLNNAWLPMNLIENSESVAATFIRAKNTLDGCNRANGCLTAPPPSCPPNSVCHDLWGRHICKCVPGFSMGDGEVCVSNCVPNPCFQDVMCSVVNGNVTCDCSITPWQGPLCNMYPRQEDNDPSVGMASASVAAIIVSIIVVIALLLLVFFLVTYYQRKKARDNFDSKFVVEDDADFDIRENVMFYDEEGAGEEDHQAYDLSKLPNVDNETMRRTDMPARMTELPRGRRAPDDRPDVGDVLHHRLDDANMDPDAPPYDTMTPFADEGAGSEAGSLSSLGSSSSDASQDYDYLNDWGPKFAKLADMYGAGAE